jgi:hypothetical protein
MAFETFHFRMLSLISPRVDKYGFQRQQLPIQIGERDISDGVMKITKACISATTHASSGAAV